MEGFVLVCVLGAADLFFFFVMHGVYTGWRLRRVAPLALRMFDAVLRWCRRLVVACICVVHAWCRVGVCVHAWCCVK